MTAGGEGKIIIRGRVKWFICNTFFFPIEIKTEMMRLTGFFFVLHILKLSALHGFSKDGLKILSVLCFANVIICSTR